jgi:hypothetical protein
MAAGAGIQTIARLAPLKSNRSGNATLSKRDVLVLGLISADPYSPERQKWNPILRQLRLVAAS